jgi:hypothetical protein
MTAARTVEAWNTSHSGRQIIVRHATVAALTPSPGVGQFPPSVAREILLKKRSAFRTDAKTTGVSELTPGTDAVVKRDGYGFGGVATR